MKTKFPLSYKKQRELLQLAKTLPKFQRLDDEKNPMWIVRKVIILGKEIREDARPENFDPTKYYRYTIKEPVMVDHKTNLFKIYKEEGQENVDLYVNFFLEEQDKFKNQDQTQENGDN